MSRKQGNWAIGLVISALALVVAFWGFQPARMWGVLQQGKYLFLLPLFVVMLIGLIVRARGWQILLGERITLTQAFFTINEGYLLNNVLPLRLGELARAYIVSRLSELKAGQVLATIVLERVIDAGISLATLLAALAFIVVPDWAARLVTGVAILVGAAIVVLAVLLLRGDALVALLRRFPGRIFPILAHLMNDFRRGLDVLSRPTDLLRALAWNFLSWVMVWLQYWLLLKAFGDGGSLVSAILLAGVIAFGAAVPSSPGAVGLYELSAVAGLMIFGYARETALSIAIMGHAVQLLGTAGLGAWGLMRDGWTVLGLADQARGLLQEARQEVSS